MLLLRAALWVRATVTLFDNLDGQTVSLNKLPMSDDFIQGWQIITVAPIWHTPYAASFEGLESLLSVGTPQAKMQQLSRCSAEPHVFSSTGLPCDTWVECLRTGHTFLNLVIGHAPWGWHDADKTTQVSGSDTYLVSHTL